jgi:hypothetical protein
MICGVVATSISGCDVCTVLCVTVPVLLNRLQDRIVGSIFGIAGAINVQESIFKHRRHRSIMVAGGL